MVEFYCDRALQIFFKHSRFLLLNELYSQLFKAPAGGAEVRGARGLAGARSAAAQKKKKGLSCLK